jgi:hypothetical protein
MDVGSVYGSYYETAKSYMGLRKEEKQAGFAEKVTDKSQVSPEDMTLEEYKAYFNEKMNSLYTHPLLHSPSFFIFFYFISFCCSITVTLNTSFFILISISPR